MELIGALTARRVVPPEMTRCECADVSFEDVAAHLDSHGLRLDDIFEKTGCGQTCTACLPDLRTFLARRRDNAA